MSRGSQTWPWHAMACYSNWKGRTFQSAMLRQTQVYTSTERCGSGTGLGPAGLQCWQCLNSREKAVIIIWSQVCLRVWTGGDEASQTLPRLTHVKYKPQQAATETNTSRSANQSTTQPNCCKSSHTHSLHSKPNLKMRQR